MPYARGADPSGGQSQPCPMNKSQRSHLLAAIAAMIAGASDNLMLHQVLCQLMDLVASLQTRVQLRSATTRQGVTKRYTPGGTVRAAPSKI